MGWVKVVTTLVLGLVLVGCSSKNVLYTDRGLAKSKDIRLDSKDSKIFYIDLETLSGNMVYIDRKYFKEAFNETLELHNAKNEFNNNAAHLVVYIEKYKLNEHRFEGEYDDATQYRIDRKFKINVNYSMYGNSSYKNSFIYNVLVKSGSYQSYDDADRKSHIKLFSKLGKMVAERALKLRKKFKKR